VIDTITVGQDPRRVAVNQETNTVYVTNQNSGTLSVIDGTTNEVIDTITVGQDPRRVVVNQETNTVYVTNQNSGTLSVIDGSTNEVIDTIKVNQPYEMAFDSRNNKVYITYSGTGMLSIVGESLKEKSLAQLFYVFLGIAIAILVGGILFNKQVRTRIKHQ